MAKLSSINKNNKRIKLSNILYKKRKNWPSEYGRKKKRDEEAIRSLKSMNEGREKMRGALGMTLDTSIEDAMNRFWILGEFLEMGEPKKLGKLDKDVKKRRELLKD